MQALKNTKAKYKEHYKGLSTEHLSQLEKPLEIREADLLLEIIRLYNSPTLNWISVGVKKYVWINYGILLAKFDGLHYTTKMLKHDLTRLEQAGLISRQEESSNHKTMVFFFVTKKADKLCVFNVVTKM